MNHRNSCFFHQFFFLTDLKPVQSYKFTYKCHNCVLYGPKLVEELPCRPSIISNDYQHTLKIFYYSPGEAARAWAVALEFLTVWIYANDKKFLIISEHPCNRIPNVLEIPKFSDKISTNGTAFEKIYCTNGNEVYSCEQQIQILRLFAIADSSINVYGKCLFFWHVLTYLPNPPIENNKYEPDSIAVEYINSKFKYVTLSDQTKLGLKVKPFDKINNENYENFGEYIKKGIRHAIAHFQRPVKNVSIKVDDLGQEYHFLAIADILRQIAKMKIEEKCSFIDSPDPSIFTLHEEITEHIKLRVKAIIN